MGLGESGKTGNGESMIKFLKTKITKDQSRDTGMAMVLVLLIVFAARKREGYLLGAILLQVLNMIVPQMYRPVAVLWLGLSNFLGSIASKVVLSIVFFTVVTPIGIARRFLGKDSLKLRAFKAGQDSVMLERNHEFISEDLERPY
jgi:hypothetical protein